MGLGLSTGRLLLRTLTGGDAEFILRLVNSSGWLTFIGDRHVADDAGAHAYIAKILGNKDVEYFVVTLRETRAPIGIITLIQREYLPHRDIGFAFLPEFEGKGYAREAAAAVLAKLVEQGMDARILATTMPTNRRSITLLEGLGLRLEQTFIHDGEPLELFGLDLT